MDLLPEKDYTFNQQLMLELVKSTWGLPTIAISAFVATGAFAGLKLASFLSSLTLPDLPGLPDLPSLPTAKEVLDNLDVGIVGQEQTKFAGDAIACLARHPKTIEIPFVGQVKDPLRATKIAACMVAKGWADDVILQWLRNIVT